MGNKDPQKLRFEFIQRVYELTGGTANVTVNMFDDVGNSLKMDMDTTIAVSDYLISERLLAPMGIGGNICITHEGIKHVENPMDFVQKPSTFNQNILNVGSMSNSGIMQGSNGAHQTINATVNDNKAIEAFLIEIINCIHNLQLTYEKQQELQAEIACIKAQLSSPKPKQNIIIEGLKTIKNILLGVAANLITPTIKTFLTGLPF